MKDFPAHPLTGGLPAPDHEVWADWLSRFPFDIFATWTFGDRWKSSPGPAQVQKYVSEWISQQDLRPAFFVIERGTSGQKRWHAHGLLGGHGPLRLEARRDALWRDWHRRYGRCEFKPLEKEGGAHEYCAKYIRKGGVPLWFISWDGTWE